MNSLLAGFTPNPDFPTTDIDPAYASRMTVLLSDPSTLNTMHENAELRIAWMGIGHKAIIESGAYALGLPYARAMSIGVAVYESIFPLAQPDSQINYKDYLLRLTGLIEAKKLKYLEIVDEATKDFKQTMPTTAGIVAEASSIITDIPDYAVIGAATARYLEISHS